MKTYLVSVGVGLLVGMIYSLFHVRSPAPPVIALVGLLGILLGEQIPPLVSQAWAGEQRAVSLLLDMRSHVFGHMTKNDARLSRAATDKGAEQ